LLLAWVIVVIFYFVPTVTNRLPQKSCWGHTLYLALSIAKSVEQGPSFLHVVSLI
jgi:hypothetical protein